MPKDALRAGFSGSELEEVVVAALYPAFATGTPVDSSAIAAEITATKPLSVTLHEKIDAAR